MIMIDEDLLDLIHEVSSEIAALGIEANNFEAYKSDPPINVAKPKYLKQPLDLAPLIEHTNLKPQSTTKDIIKLCDEARRYRFRGVCVNPIFVEKAVRELMDTNCRVIVAVGFPHGANLTNTKVMEAKTCIKMGSDEVDMVISLGALKENNYEFVYEDIRSVVEAVKPSPVKVIIEAGILEKKEKIAACILATRAGAKFLKTSTGFALVKNQNNFLELRGATEYDVRLMRAVVIQEGKHIGIKASGGIKDLKTAQKMINAGATLLGCSASVRIIAEQMNSMKFFENRPNLYML